MGIELAYLCGGFYWGQIYEKLTDKKNDNGFILIVLFYIFLCLSYFLSKFNTLILNDGMKMQNRVTFYSFIAIAYRFWFIKISE